MPLGPRTLLLALLMGTALPGPARAARDDERDVAALRWVVELFRSSIIDRDKQTVIGLGDRVVWSIRDPA